MASEIWSTRPAGHFKRLICDGVRAFCGNVDDGISFCFEGEGGWVISYADFRKLFDNVEEARKKTPYRTWEEVMRDA